ncbi:hypothetical protein GCM10009609_47850 [Pseudonocardia aurantiaca]
MPGALTTDALKDARFMGLVGAGVPATADGPATAKRLCEIVREAPMLGGISAYRLSEAGFTDSGTFLFHAIATYCPEVQEALLDGDQPPN